jgi:hypothetical protein
MTHTFTNSFLYEQTDIPFGLTLKEWRASSERSRRKPRRARALERMRPRAPRSSAA